MIRCFVGLSSTSQLFHSIGIVTSQMMTASMSQYSLYSWVINWNLSWFHWFVVCVRCSMCACVCVYQWRFNVHKRLLAIVKRSSSSILSFQYHIDARFVDSLAWLSASMKSNGTHNTFAIMLFIEVSWFWRFPLTDQVDCIAFSYAKFLCKFVINSNKRSTKKNIVNLVNLKSSGWFRWYHHLTHIPSSILVYLSNEHMQLVGKKKKI